MPELIPCSPNASNDWGPVAVVQRSLGAIIDSHGLRQEWQHRPLEGGWLLEAVVRLSPGRCAYLVETRTAPGEFTLHLERHREQFYFREDFDEVRQFLELADSEVAVLTGQVRWWKKKAPTLARRAPNIDRLTPQRPVIAHEPTLQGLASAVKSHSGTFECEAIGDPRRTKKVPFRHLTTKPDSAHLDIPSLGGLAEFFSVFGEVQLYRVDVSGECAKRIASPAEWPNLKGLLREWLRPYLDSAGGDAVPAWIDDCLVIGEEPRTGNFLVVPCTTVEAGRVFLFSHDDFTFTEVARSITAFVVAQIELTDVVLTDIATVLRIADPHSASQWWIRRAVDNRGRIAQSASGSH